jgi:hypothetical protein
MDIAHYKLKPDGGYWTSRSMLLLFLKGRQPVQKSSASSLHYICNIVCWEEKWGPWVGGKIRLNDFLMLALRVVYTEHKVFTFSLHVQFNTGSSYMYIAQMYRLIVLFSSHVKKHYYTFGNVRNVPY